MITSRGLTAAKLQGDSVTGPVQVLVVGFDDPTFSRRGAHRIRPGYERRGLSDSSTC